MRWISVRGEGTVSFTWWIDYFVSSVRTGPLAWLDSLSLCSRTIAPELPRYRVIVPCRTCSRAVWQRALYYKPCYRTLLGFFICHSYRSYDSPWGLWHSRALVIAWGFWRIPIFLQLSPNHFLLFQLRCITSRSCSLSSPSMFSLFHPCVTGDTTVVGATVIFSFSLRVLDPRYRSARDSRLMSQLSVNVRIP